MGQQQIKCTVSSCYYYAQGNNCAASSIMVAGDAQAENFKYEVGTIGSEAPVHVDSSHETCCATFIPQQQGPKPGIHRLNVDD